MTMAISRGGEPARGRAAGWVLAAAQCGYAVWFAVCLYLALARAATFAGHWYVPAFDDAYTANADVVGGWAAARAVTITVQVTPLVAGFGLVASTLLFIVGYPSGRRGLTVAMIGGAAAMVLILAVLLSPPGRSITGWLSD